VVGFSAMPLARFRLNKLSKTILSNKMFYDKALDYDLGLYI